MNRGRLVLRAYKMGFGDSFLISSYKDQHRNDFLVDFGTKVGCNCGTHFSQVVSDINTRSYIIHIYLAPIRTLIHLPRKNFTGVIQSSSLEHL